MRCIYNSTLEDGTVLYVYRESVHRYHMIWITDNGFGFRSYCSRSGIRKFIKKQFGIKKAP